MLAIRRNLLARRPHVRFVFDPAARDVGSTVMRGEQLFELARRYLGSDYDLGYEPLTSDFYRSTLFLTKAAVKSLDSARLERLKRRGNRLMFDLLDERPPETTALADVVVASSVVSLEKHGRAWPGMQVVLLNHHVDPRVRAVAARTAPCPEFSAGYVGNEANGLIDDEVRARLEVVHVYTDRRDDSWLEAVARFNLHYALRRERGHDDTKPFLKGFTAAACSAVVLVHESDREAAWWLGPDYPLIVRGELRTPVGARALDEARDVFGTRRWQEAGEVMRGLADRTTDERIAGELARLLA